MLEDGDLPLSKSEIKRQLNDIKQLGRELSLLSVGELKKMPLSHEALEAVIELQRITSNAAKKRQTQFVTKVLSREDNLDEIRAAFEALKGQTMESNAEFHLAEQWRGKLITDGNQAMTEFMKTYPRVSSQELRHLIQKTIKERTQQVNHGAYRALFRFIKTIISENS